MIKTLKTLVAVAALSGTVAANAHAQEVIVKKGDTLWELSQVHNASVENIKNWNQLSTDLIHPGDRLKIPVEKRYTVKQNDTLWEIANHYNVTAEQIRIWNSLATDLIHPGLNLVIYDEQVGGGLTAAPPEQQPAAKQVKSEQTSQPTAATDSVTEKDNSSASSGGETAPTGNTAGTKEITVRATAYTAECEGCSGVTATGVNLQTNPNAKVISVDPSVIPLGSKVYIEGYGTAIAADTGGAIKGNRIDVFIPSHEDAIKWGSKELKVKILN